MTNAGVRLLPEVLKTPRLSLRKPCMADAAAIFTSYTQDLEVARYMAWKPHATLAETEAFLADCAQWWEAGDRRPYILSFKGDEQEPVGMLDARVMGHIVDVGYLLARRYWGKGLMPEAVQALTQAALAMPKLFRVQATCDVENLASARTLEKAGFIREARLERYTVHPNISAEPRACYMYACCK